MPNKFENPTVKSNRWIVQLKPCKTNFNDADVAENLMPLLSKDFYPEKAFVLVIDDDPVIQRERKLP